MLDAQVPHQRTRTASPSPVAAGIESWYAALLEVGVRNISSKNS